MTQDNEQRSFTTNSAKSTPGLAPVTVWPFFAQRQLTLLSGRISDRHLIRGRPSVLSDGQNAIEPVVAPRTLDEVCASAVVSLTQATQAISSFPPGVAASHAKQKFADDMLNLIADI